MTEFISRKYGDKEYEIIIKTDSKEDYTAAECFARRLIDHAKPKTNADRIRAMSDEELAEFICSRCRFQDLANTMCGAIISCDGNCLEWLKQPMEGE